MNDLLLLHGAIGAKSQFTEIAGDLEKNFRIHSLNFTGHGGKDFSESFSIEMFADDVLLYLSANGLESIDVFGYSMGGYVAVYLARFHPEKIGKVFTFATKFSWTPEIAQKEIRFLDSEKIELKLPAFALELKHRHIPSDWKKVLSETRSMMINLGNSNPLKDDDYKNINHKILIGIGDKDTMVTLEETISVYRQLPNAAFLVLPNTLHPLEKINVEQLVYHIRLFLMPQSEATDSLELM